MLVANGHTKLTNEPNPQPVIRRGGGNENYWILYNDIAAAYGDALRWKLSGDTNYAVKAVEYLDRWASTLQALEGNSNVALAAGMSIGANLAHLSLCSLVFRRHGALRGSSCEKNRYSKKS